MAIIDIKPDPSRRELIVFAGLWGGFFPLIGYISARAGDGLLVFAAVAGICFVLSAFLNREYGLPERLVGASLPIAAAAIWAVGGALRSGGLTSPVITGLFVGLGGVVGLAGAGAVLGSRVAGRSLYRAWMLAVLPIGWTLSHLLLGVVFFGVITPIGLAMRALGRDPMQRERQHEAESYWLPRAAAGSPRQYLRQF